ncbi:restriction endonuclease subunit S, partial [Mycoplasma sp. Z244C]
NLSHFFNIFEEILTFYKRKSEKLENLKKSLLEKMFVSDGEQFPAIRFKVFTNTWEKRKLNYFYSFSKGSGIPVGSLYEGDGNQAICYGNLYTHYGDVINEVHLSSNEYCNKLSKVNELLFPTSSTVPFGTAKTSAIMLENVKLGGDIVVASPKNNNIYSPFISYQINAFKEKMFHIISGTTITHMYGKDISDLEYSFTNMKEQKSIANIFIKADALLTFYKRKCDKLENIKKSLLEKMFC